MTVRIFSKRVEKIGLPSVLSRGGADEMGYGRSRVGRGSWQHRDEMMFSIAFSRQSKGGE